MGISLFFTGLTVGRVALLWVNKRVSFLQSCSKNLFNPTPEKKKKKRSEKDVSYSSTHFWQSGKFSSFQTQSFFKKIWTEKNFPFKIKKKKSLEITIWFTPSLIGNAIAISFIGILLGPMFPITMNYASCILPRRILTGSIGWIAGFGSAGSALFPFITGALTSKEGIKSLQPL